MGMRNLAMARVSLDKRLPFNTVPNVTDWRKMNITQWGNISPNEPFEPLKYASVVHRLVNEVLLPEGEPLPDVLLVERQRSRSAGSASVSEWVFRVNMIEAMLHSFVHARLMTEKLKTEVVSASPQRMGFYWRPDDAAARGKDAKKFRSAYVEGLLSDFVDNRSPKLTMSSSFGLVKDFDRFLPQIMNSAKGQNSESFGPEKADDLVDALLHSLAWIQWQGNRTVVRLELVSGVEDAWRICDELYERHNVEMNSVKVRKARKKTKKLEYDPNVTRTAVEELESI